MKKLFLLPLLLSLFVFVACEKDAQLDALTPQSTQNLPADQNPGDDPAALKTYKNFGKNSVVVIPQSEAIADFFIQNQSGAVEELATLSIANNSLNAVSYEWDFGNGDVVQGENPDYAFPYHGFYTVTLRATDDKGLVSTATQDLMVICIYGGNEHDF